VAPGSPRSAPQRMSGRDLTSDGPRDPRTIPPRTEVCRPSYRYGFSRRQTQFSSRMASMASLAPAEEYGVHTRQTAKGVGPSSATASGRIWLAALLAALGTFILAWLLSPGLRSDLGQVAVFLSALDAAALQEEWILSFGAFSAVVYFLVVVAQVIVSPIPAGPVTFAGAMIFGVPQGLALSMAGSVVGSVLVFAAARKWGKPLAVRLVGEDTFYKYAGRLDREGWWLFVILLVPLMPDDAVCALAGLSALRFRRFLVFMVVGRLPGATLTALLASDLVTQSAAGWIVAGIVLVVLVTLGFVYRKRLEFWILRRADEGQSHSGSYGESKEECSR
jgi:uncharacterized membrane protein YdjX (TVP38/TMEM64 family)